MTLKAQIISDYSTICLLAHPSLSFHNLFLFHTLHNWQYQSHHYILYLWLQYYLILYHHCTPQSPLPPWPPPTATHSSCNVSNTHHHYKQDGFLYYLPPPFVWSWLSPLPVHGQPLMGLQDSLLMLPLGICATLQGTHFSWEGYFIIDKHWIQGLMENSDQTQKTGLAKPLRTGGYLEFLDDTR